jgi:hypothetical protein
LIENWPQKDTRSGSPVPNQEASLGDLRYASRCGFGQVVIAKGVKNFFDLAVFGMQVTALLIDFPNRLFFSTSPHRGREEILLFTVFGNKI